MEDYENILCVKNEVFVYKIPARPSNRGYRAADWTLDQPDWTGRLRVTSKSKQCFIKLDDKISGELFAQCPVDAYPGISVEQVLDSSRYFVIRIQDPNGRNAFIGIGFADRGDSFDLIVSLQDHFKQLKREEQAIIQTAEFTTGPKLDLGFKEGQTIKININTKKCDDDEEPRKPRAKLSNLGGGLLPPPPPGGVKIATPKAAPQPATFHPAAPVAPVAASAAAPGNNLDLLLDFGTHSQPVSQPVNQPNNPPAQPSADLWGDFASAGNSSSAASNSGGWVNFN